MPMAESPTYPESEIEGLGTDRRQVERDRVLHRFRLDDDLREPVEAPVIGERFTPPGGGDHVELCPEPVPRLAHVHAESGELRRLVPPADPEFEAPAREYVEGGVVLRQA